MLKLRRVDRQSRMLAQLAAHWREQGWDASMEAAPRVGRWLPVGDEQRRWHGWLEPRVWLEQVAPELAGLARGAVEDGMVAQLIAACEPPLEWPMPELAYRRLRVGDEVGGAELPRGELLRVATPQGPVWLDKVLAAESPMTAAADPLARLVLPLRFELGGSDISLDLLRSVRLGDMLLIQQPAARVSCNGVVVGRYQQFDGEIRMEWQEEEAGQASEAAMGSFGQLPVRLEFVLQQSQVTLDELRKLCQGQLLPLAADAERRVEVRANGALLGRGELVQLDGQLGIEVAQWLGGAVDVE